MSAEEETKQKVDGAFKTLIKRSTLANIVAGFVVVAGITYFMVTRDTESVKFLVAFGAGWLFKEVAREKK